MTFKVRSVGFPEIHDTCMSREDDERGGVSRVVHETQLPNRDFFFLKKRFDSRRARSRDHRHFYSFLTTSRRATSLVREDSSVLERFVTFVRRARAHASDATAAPKAKTKPRAVNREASEDAASSW